MNTYACNGSRCEAPRICGSAAFLPCERACGHTSFLYEVPESKVSKSCNFWDITKCSPLEVNRRFVGRCCLHPQG
jgi:hypothetical protein